MKRGVPYFGAEAYIASWGLNVAGDQHSSTNMWVQNGPPDQLNVILAGWTVSPMLYGDDHTRLFTFWTVYNAWITGCYNQLCSGFITIDTVITPGLIVSPISFWGGSQYDTKYLIYQDRPTGNWCWKQWDKPSDGNFRVGCYFRNIQFVNPRIDATEEFVDKSCCYALLNQRNCGHDEMYYCYCFTFGGPGGKSRD
ncbi:hypothetical protein Pint_23199 [Pistacia integerrima]|uniref:Uncharacterized protein n=1 Tax=Pistacia integerrima TaxID=434235 RepID=A0ACC0YIU2_9ROSI|nr:hypothetical protein Pint_23199 [Pistacia integerrima]